MVVGLAQKCVYHTLVVAIGVVTSVAVRADDHAPEAGHVWPSTPAEMTVWRKRIASGEGYYNPANVKGPAALAIDAWLKTKRVECYKNNEEKPRSCVLQGLVQAIGITYAGPIGDAQRYAIANLNYAPDGGNFGEDVVALWRKGSEGYVAEGMVPTEGYDADRFRFADGRILYTAGTADRFALTGGRDPHNADFVIKEPEAGGGAPTIVPVRSEKPKPGPTQPHVAEDAVTLPVRLLFAIPVDKIERAMFRPEGREVLGRLFTAAFIQDWTLPVAPGQMGFDGDPRTWQMGEIEVNLIRTDVRWIGSETASVAAVADVRNENGTIQTQTTFDVFKVGGKWLINDIHDGADSARAFAIGDATPIAGAKTVMAPAIVASSSTSAKSAVGGAQMPYVHNGSHMTVDVATGTITYYAPKPAIAGTVHGGDIVFRGHIDRNSVVGTAYVFRRGCAPAPYAVSGPGFKGEGDRIILDGAAPVRAAGSCAVTGRSPTGGNAHLVFEPAGGAEE